mgnify:CR=1 FL=1
MQKILIVEDDLAIQALLHDFIQEAGYEVTLASDGVEALSYFSERSFDLVLLDIMLPKIDGYGVCEVIRRKSNIPIVMLTALDAEENQIKGLDLEADVDTKNCGDIAPFFPTRRYATHHIISGFNFGLGWLQSLYNSRAY